MSRCTRPESPWLVIGAFIATVALGGGSSPAIAATGSDAGTGPSVHFDKPAQRRLRLLTRRADAPPPIERWPARVVPDPQGRMRVMADQPGTLESPAGGFPAPGDPVRAGQLLARLRPALGELQRLDLEADWATAKRDVALGRLQIARYSIDEAESLEVRLMTPSLQILIDYRAALVREAQLARALQDSVELRAPADGVIRSSRTRAGRVVTTGEPLFELEATDSLVVEAHFADSRFDGGAARHALATFDGQSRLLPLHFIGDEINPRNHARRLLYRIAAPGHSLRAGEPLQLLVPRARLANATFVPASSVFTRAGRQWLWTHRDAETFVALPVTARPVDHAWLQVDDGLAGGERIVVDARALRGGRSP